MDIGTYSFLSDNNIDYSAERNAEIEFLYDTSRNDFLTAYIMRYSLKGFLVSICFLRVKLR